MFLQASSGLVFTLTINVLSTAIHYPLPTPPQTITSDFLSKVKSALIISYCILREYLLLKMITYFKVFLNKYFSLF